LEETLRTIDIMCYSLKRVGLQGAGVVIRPQVSDCHWTDFPSARECIKAGREAALQKIREIHRVMRYGNICQIFSKTRAFWAS